MDESRGYSSQVTVILLGRQVPVYQNNLVVSSLRGRTIVKEVKAEETQHKGITISDLKGNETQYRGKTISDIKAEEERKNNPSIRLFGKLISPCGSFKTSPVLHQYQPTPGDYSVGESSRIRASSSLHNHWSLRSQEVNDSRNQHAVAVQVGAAKSQNVSPSNAGGLLIPQNPFHDQQDTRGKEKAPVVCTSNTVPAPAFNDDGPCYISQNPAEFSFPEPANEFTIDGGSLTLLSWNDGKRKRGRPAKVTQAEEGSRRRRRS